MVAFYSYASNLVAGDTNGESDIFVHDRDSGETTRVSVDSAGREGNNASYIPSISADGRLVAFTSDASNLVAGDTNEKQDIFVKALTIDDPVTDAFVDQLDVQPGALIESNEIIISGLDKALPLKIRRSGEYSLNGGEYTRDTEGVTVNNGDRLRVRHYASTRSGKPAVTVIKFGRTKMKFTSTTYVFDITPDEVSFTNATDVPAATVVESDAVLITGINVAAKVTVRGGEYRINGGGYTKEPGTVNSGDTIQVRHISAARSGKSKRTILRVGKTKLPFLSTTE